MGRDIGGATVTADLLQLLGTAWLLEPDEAMLGSLAKLPGLDDDVSGITKEDAALEYSRIVLQLVPPYASLYLDEEAMLNSSVTEQVELEYRRQGFAIQSEWRAGPADHLGIELHFLAYLFDQDRPLAIQFLDAHMLSWAPICLLAIARIEPSRLYRRLASVTLSALSQH